MDLFSFFGSSFEDERTRQIAREQVRKMIKPQPKIFESPEVAELQADVKFLTLIVAALIKRLDETKTMNMNDLGDLMSEIDTLDGVADGGLDVSVLRNLLGVFKQVDDNAKDELSEFKIEVTPRYRDRANRPRY